MELRPVDRYLENLRGEQDGAALYDAVAAAEENEKLRVAGVEAPSFRPSVRTRLLAFLARRGGARFVLPGIFALEQADRAKYDNQPDARAAGMPRVID